MIIHDVLVWLAEFVISVINKTGEFGVFILSTLESANIPIPSEVIMPFGGFAASTGTLSIWLVILAGALGNLTGSLISYWVGFKGGRIFIERYGKYFFVSTSDLEKGDKYFKKYGTKIAFWSRLLPIVRTFISLPAGINKAPLASFSTFTFIGSLLWSALLASLGFWLGENWTVIRPYFEQFTYAIAGLIILGLVIYIWYHLKDRKQSVIIK